MTRRLIWLTALSSVACFSEPPIVTGDESSGSTSTAAVPTGTTDGSVGSTTIDPDTTAGDVESTGTTTGEPQSCMGDDECMDAAAPFCSPVLQECVTCSGMPDPQAACMGRDPALPACSDGVCVQCTTTEADACQDTTPICDEGTNTCVACTEHAQCSGAACNLFTGACLPGDAVVSVGPGAQDFANLSDAVNTIPAGQEGTIIVHDDVYNESVTVTGGRVVAFLANGVSSPEWRPAGANPQLTVSGTATVLLDGIQLRGNLSSAVPGLRVDNGNAWIDRGRITENYGGAVTAQNGAELVLRNCFLNGEVDTGVLSSVGATVDVLYSTLAASLGSTTALSCDMASMVRVRDSIIVSRSTDPEVACDSIDAEHTATEVALPGAENAGVGDVALTWFTNYNGGDYHLTPAGQGIFADLAQWNAVPREPRVDIDGDPRAAADGVSEHAGADLP